ncbi:terminase large subunit [Listeria booriae]|uniref:terminase large subunit n=1 Tax=Listeria booriae TaxID=1552123 RepID=UPI001628710E|nr:terminase TerL endonuclease subunit [Listeria booriae]MBC2367825.1 terminase large subunit [Listeria booriae]
MIEVGINYADIFADEALANPSKYPDSIMKCVRRYKKWMKRTDIWFDVDRANMMLDFTETYCKHSTGRWAGTPIVLESWERFLFSYVYGFVKKNERGAIVRVIKKIYVQLPKKNGKTIVGGMPIVYAMYGEGVKGIQTYCAATDFDQAQNGAVPIALTIENSPTLAKNSQVYRAKEDKVKRVVYRFIEDGIKYSNSFDVLTKNADGTDGKSPYAILVDEVHAQKNAEQYDNLKSAQGAHDEPLMWVVSTAGKDSGSVGFQIYQYATEVNDLDNDDSWLAFISEPNKGYDWEDRDVWRMVNLNMGVSIDMEFLENAFKEAKNSAHRKAEFLSKHLDVFVNSADTYFEKEHLDKMLVSDLNDIEGLQAVVGLDLSRTTDLTCVTFEIISYDDDGKCIVKNKQMYFIPSHNIEEKEKERNIPYRELSEKGFVTICEGRHVDYDDVFDYIMSFVDTLDIVQLNYDPALASKLVEKFEMQGITCVEVPQHCNSMNESIDDFEIILSRNQVITDNPLFIYCMANMAVFKNVNGMKRPSKISSKSHIDGASSFLTAHKEVMNMMDDIDFNALDEQMNSLFRRR